MSEAETILSMDGLFAETAQGPRLLGSRCETCETAYFPRTYNQNVRTLFFKFSTTKK